MGDDTISYDDFIKAAKMLEEAPVTSGQWFLPMSAWAYDSLKTHAEWVIMSWANPLKRVWMWLRGYRKDDVKWAHYLLEVLGCHERVEYIRSEECDEDVL